LLNAFGECHRANNLPQNVEYNGLKNDHPRHQHKAFILAKFPIFAESAGLRFPDNLQEKLSPIGEEISSKNWMENAG
jgi:hypothetical protein